MSQTGKPIEIRYDDNQLDVVEKINVALKEAGLILVDDGEEHDGFVIYQLEKIKQGN